LSIHQILANQLPELIQINRLVEDNPTLLRCRQIAEVDFEAVKLPIHALEMGNPSQQTPCIAFVGGVHGLERIGTQVVISLLETLTARYQWDKILHRLLEQVRILFIPLLNPAGMAAKTRSNGQHVDLMRNAPIDSIEKAAWLVGGQRLSPKIPWYRGRHNDPMQPESQALVDCIREELFDTPFSLILDCHSGFGSQDRIWFPYARTRKHPIGHLGEVFKIRELFFQTYPYQNYLFEPQAHHYTCHGDLWDYLYLEAQKRHHTMIPLTLEMGSWRWVRKNPWQLKQALGMFHPVKPHRVKRVLRSHLILMNFLIHITASYPNWRNPNQCFEMAEQARKLWYE
jgi:hypothetical protein